jgi:radical SAM-linked protein
LRFSSHRDFQRAFERALRKAEIPMAYSAGFNPRPKVSYANAAPTGTASEAEYLEISVVKHCDPDQVAAALDAALPVGLDVVEAVEVRISDLAHRLEASLWEIDLRGVDPVEVARAVATLLDAKRVEVSRLTKNGVRTFDARGPILTMWLDADNRPPGHQDEEPDSGARARSDGDREDQPEVRSDDSPGQAGTRGVPAEADSCAILQVVVRQVTPAVRPDDVLTALTQLADLVLPVPPVVTRRAQGPLAPDARSVLDPLAPDRSGAAVGT